MALAVLGVGVAQVVLHVLGQQVAPVAGRIDQHVGRRRRDRAVENRLERLVTRLALIEAQVVAEHDEFLGPLRHHLDDVRQVGQFGLVDLDQAQPLRRIGVQAGANQRRLAGAAGAGQQHVVGRLAFDELPRVALDLFLLQIDFLQRIERHRGHVAHRLQRAMARTAPAVAPGDRGIPVGGRRQRLRQDRLDPGDELFGALEQVFKLLVHDL
ncbi:hypothetical protein L963_1879 [Leuconostoc mesenteroides subsp. cremoris T26]|nr:hypothetical protein L963_1879 [Leuconostoc mesenteroides subsp. cremoris T26]